MKKYKIRYGNDFEQDIDRVVSFLLVNGVSEDKVHEILEQIYSDILHLESNPRLGAKLSNKTTIPNDYRYLVSGKYLLFYKVFDAESLVRLYRIFHSKENYLSKLGL